MALLLVLLAAAPTAQARRPVISYVDATTGVFSLYDSETASSPAAPSLPTGITRYAMSSNGRYIAYWHPTTPAIRLFDRQTAAEVPLPGVDVVASPRSLSVSDSGAVAFDDNGNGPARVYDSAAGAFAATGLPADNGHRQTSLSANGSRLATTCLGGFPASPCEVDLGSDGAVFVQDLVTDSDTAFPDDIATAGEPSENRPCLDADGSVVGFDVNVGGATGNDLFLYDRVLAALVTPAALQTAAHERECSLDKDGAYVGLMDDAGNARVYDRDGAAFLTLPAAFQGLTAPIFLTQPFVPADDGEPEPEPDPDPPSDPTPTATPTVPAQVVAPPAPRAPTPRRPARPPLLTASALDATNALMALPWKRLARHTMDDYPDRDREPRTLADGSGSKKVAGVNVKWSLWLKGRSITPFADIRSPPGFSVLEPRRVKLEVPRTGGWKFGWDGELAARARLKVGGETVFSWSPEVGFGLELSDIKLAAEAQLDASEPERPLLDRAIVTARARIRGRGAIPVDIPVSLTARLAPRRLSLTGDFTGFKIDLGARNARVSGKLDIDVLPTERPVNVDIDAGSLKNKRVGTSLSVGLADVRVRFDGKLKLTLPRVGERTLGFKLDWRTGLIPTNEQVLDMLDLIAPPRPRPHGEGAFEPFFTAPAAGYRQVADDFEATLGQFLPWDGVLSRTWSTLQPPALNQYAVEADSAIWTGHLLAAESYRFASLPAGERAQAGERIGQLLTGLERLFRVTEDAVVVRKESVVVGPPPKIVVKKVRTPVDPARSGLFSRVVRQDASDDRIGPPLSERGCYYEWAEGGWTVSGRGVARRRVATFRDANAILRANPGAVAEPIAPVWHGWGCSDNHPLSRDQIAGVALGLATAHQIVDDPQVRARAKAMFDRLLRNLLRNDWNVVLPPENEAPMSSSFMGQWDKQLALLLVGSKISPDLFAARYARYRAAAATSWLPLWASSLDPITQYYKFNLSHAWATLLMTYETDPVARAGYQFQYDTLRRAIRHHRNAYFDLLRILTAPAAERASVRDGDSDAFAGVVMADQIRSTLAEYLLRRVHQAGPLGRPTNANSEAAAAYQRNLWPDRVARFVAFDGTPRCLSTMAMPVWARSGAHQDFMWQTDPFALAAGENACPQRGIGGPPSLGSLVAIGASPRREGPGVDYLLAYWMAVYLGVLPPGA